MSYERLSSPLVSEFPIEWYDTETDHFWLAWRLQILQHVLKDYRLDTLAPLNVFEIGCGAGVLRYQLEKLTSWSIDGTDLNEKAIEKVTPGRGRTMLYDVETRQPPFKDHYDGVLLFDVLEHIQDSPGFLSAALWHLKPGGWILINVPALQSLYSRYDELVGHVHRYDIRSMRSLLEDHRSEMDILDIRYWGFSLIPVAWLRKQFLRRSQTPQQAIAHGFHTPTRWVNYLFRGLMRLETSLLRHPRWGSSLMVLARKRLP